MSDVALIERRTTGSISTGSTSLTVASSTGFEIGDVVIVEVGGEAGAGVRGTKGVGGTWPALSYANAAAMNADTGQTTNRYAWLEDTGRVYQWNRYVANQWNLETNNKYYAQKAVPRALIAEITNKVGNVLTLDTAATVAATNANVYFDNWPILGPLVSVGSSGSTGVVYTMPCGNYAFSDIIDLTLRTGWTLEGQGKEFTTLFTPDGCSSMMVRAATAPSTTFRRFHVLGNTGFNGFGLRYSDGFAQAASGGNFVTEFNLPQGTSFPRGIALEASSNSVVEDVKITDAFHNGIRCDQSHNSWAYRCEVVSTAPRLDYIEWAYQWVDCAGGGTVDCSLDSDTLMPGPESFKSTGVTFTRFRSRNGSFSSNSSDNFLIDEPRIIIEANSQYAVSVEGNPIVFSTDNPIINVNRNIGSGHNTLPIEVRNPYIVQEGYVNAANDTLIAINIGATLPDVYITGTYLEEPDLPKGYINLPDYLSPSGLHGAVAVNSTNLNTVIEGIRVVGAANLPYRNFTISNGKVTNCIMENAIGGTQDFNLTNAQWEAQRVPKLSTYATDSDEAIEIQRLVGSVGDTMTQDAYKVSDSNVNAQTGTSYTLLSSDNGKTVVFSSNSAVTCTVPSGLGKGFSCTIIQIGSGQVTFSASGVTINPSSTLKIAAQHGAASLFAYTSNIFNLCGNISA